MASPPTSRSRSSAQLLLATVLAIGFPAGCTSLGYYAQSIGGQIEVLRSREPITQVIASPRTPQNLRDKLALVLEIRAFASDELDLPDSKSFRTFVRLKRPYAVWIVAASPELSLEPKEWCYPVIGCASYRGYFDHERARAFAEQTAAEGYDVHLAGVPAYSTLGYFADPLYSTVAGWSETKLAGLIFHELAHERLYVRDDSTFNESFATVVAAAGLERWLTHRHGSSQLQQHRHEQAREESFLQLVFRTRERLEQVYGSQATPDRKRWDKVKAFQQLQVDYAQWKVQWGGYTGYDPLFAEPWNNARLTALGTYRDQLPAFEALLFALGDDLPAFYREAERLGELSPEERASGMQFWAARARRSHDSFERPLAARLADDAP
jgi:predicted aminopeptidase